MYSSTDSSTILLGDGLILSSTSSSVSRRGYSYCKTICGVAIGRGILPAGRPREAIPQGGAMFPLPKFIGTEGHNY